MALPFGIFTSCSSPTGSPPPTTVTKTKNVTVSFPAFDLSTNPTTISLAPIFTPDSGWDENFSASDIVWTVTDSKSNSFPNGIIEIKSNNIELYPSSLGNWPWPPPLFTITFYYKTVDADNKLGEYKVFIGDYGNHKCFDIVAADDGDTSNEFDINDTQFTTGIVPTPPLTLTLSKEVTE
jgi:hypothetical protein